MASPSSNPNAKVPGASPGGTPPGTVPNMGQGYKPPTVVVIDPDANPYYGQSKATNAQITGAGTGGTGTDVIAPSPVVQITSPGLAQTLGVAPGSYVPSGTTVTPATGQNSLVVAAPKASTVNTSTDNFYSFASNGKTVNVQSSQYDSWTPQQQFAYQQSQGLLPKGAQISFNKDGSWGYTTPSGSGNAAPASTVLTKYTDSNGNVNLAAALAAGVRPDFLAQQGFSQQQISQAQTYNSVMTQLKPYASGGGYNIQQALADGKITSSQLQSVGFSSSVVTQAETNNAIMAILNNPKNGLVQYQQGSGNGYNLKPSGYDIAKALANKNVTAADLQAVGFSAQVVAQAETSNAIMAILNNPKNDLSDGKGGYYLSKALASKRVTNADLLTAGFTQAQIDGTAAPAVAASSSSAASKGAAVSGRDATKVGTKTKTITVSKVAATKSVSSQDVMTEINSALTSKKTMSGQVSALNDAIENAGFWNNALLGKRVLVSGTVMYADAKGNLLTQQDQVKIEWNNLTADQKNQVAGLYSQDLYRTNPFSETTRQIAEAGQQGGIVGQMAVAPLTGITIPIAKATSKQKVTAQDIEGAVITAVGDVLMVGGGFEPLTETTTEAGKVIATSAAPAVKIITSSLLAGMGTIGIVNTVLQVKKGGASGVAIAVEAGMSVAALVAGAGGLVSSIVPKDAPNVDAAQQFINKMSSETTPEGLAKNSPLLAESGDLSEGPVSAKDTTPLGGELRPSISAGQSSGFLKANFTPSQIFAEGHEPPPFDEMSQEMATKTANVTADYKNFAQAAIDYAQNQHDINDVSAKLADNRIALKSIQDSDMSLPDQYTAKLASDTAAMEKTLATLKGNDPDLAKTLDTATDTYKTSLKSYVGYLKSNGFMADDSGLNEAIKTLPGKSSEMIKTTINQLMNADNSPEAIARQQEVVDAANKEYQQFKGKSGQSADLGTKVIEEQAKLAQMKVGSLSQANSELIQAREALSDVHEIMDNGKLNDAAKTNLSKIQDQLESQIADRENLIRTQLIEGKGTQDIVKIEWIKDSEGENIGARIYSNEGVARYNLDEDGNIDYSTKTDETTGRGGDKSPNAPTETRPSPDTTSAEESALHQTSRGMPKGGILTSVVASVALTLPNIKVSKNGEVAKPSTKTQTSPQSSPSTKPQKKPATVNPAKSPPKVKTEVVAPQTSTNPAINPNTVQQSAQQKAQQKAQQQNQQQQKAQSPNQQQSQSQQQSQEQDMSQEMQPALAISAAVNAPVATATDVQPPPDSITPILAKGKKPGGETGELTDEQRANAAAAHKAGFGWWYFVTGLGWRFSIKPPPGAKAVKDGKGSGYASVQTIKGKPVVSMHRMGAVNVTINRPTKQPGARGAISYRAAGTGRPGLSATRLGQTIHIKGVGVARKVPRGRILSS